MTNNPELDALIEIGRQMIDAEEQMIADVQRKQTERTQALEQAVMAAAMARTPNALRPYLQFHSTHAKPNAWPAMEGATVEIFVPDLAPILMHLRFERRWYPGDFDDTIPGIWLEKPPYKVMQYTPVWDETDDGNYWRPSLVDEVYCGSKLELVLAWAEHHGNNLTAVQLECRRRNAEHLGKRLASADAPPPAPTPAEQLYDALRNMMREIVKEATNGE